MENKTAGLARNMIRDVFRCKYKGGYGEKLLKFLERSGTYFTVVLENIIDSYFPSRLLQLASTQPKIKQHMPRVTRWGLTLL